MNETLTKNLPDFVRGHFFHAYYNIIKFHDFGEASAYLMTLSALMLGLDVKFQRYNTNKRTERTFLPSFRSPTHFTVSDNKRSHDFWESASDKTINLASVVETKDKIRAKAMLVHAGLSTPIGGAAAANNTTTLDKLEQAGVARLIVKPATGSHSKGIIERATVEQARAHIQSHTGTTFVVEQQIPGHVIRAHVVGDKVVGAIVLRPAGVIGDGVRTLTQLVERKLKERNSSPRNRALTWETAKFKEYLDAHKISVDTVIANKQFFPLTDSTLPDSQGDLVWCLDLLTAEDKKLCIQAANLFGLKHAGIDIIKSRSGKSYVLELNSKPALGGMSFPTHGHWNLHVPEALLRWHFPKLGDQVHTIKRYDYLRLLSDYQSNTEQNEFSAADYVEFA